MEEMIQVKNRSTGSVGYALKDRNLVRDFNTGEIKKISKEELIQVSYQPGGKRILKDYLQILTDDKEFLSELLGQEVEPEYNYSKEDVIDIMLNGSLDKFLDLLDFAPKAILEIVKTESVRLNLNDVSKREAIKNKTGFDVTAALKHLAEEKEEAAAIKKEEPSKRRVVEEKEETIPKRRIVE